MKIKIAIKNRWTGEILFEYEKENNTLKDTVSEFIRKELSEGKYRANLTCANLTDANLTCADLTRADLTCADLTCANLTDANLTRANLTDANLTRANLTRANLTDADLTCADLTRANLTDANLLQFKSDIWRILLQAKKEIPAFKKSLIDGKINGSAYSGSCACLKGTIANIKGCTVEEAGYVRNTSEPGELWFLQFKEGQTPENSIAMKLTLEWVEEFEKLISA